jgi:hypothetical protein
MTFIPANDQEQLVHARDLDFLNLPRATQDSRLFTWKQLSLAQFLNGTHEGAGKDFVPYTVATFPYNFGPAGLQNVTIVCYQVSEPGYSNSMPRRSKAVKSMPSMAVTR